MCISLFTLAMAFGMGWLAGWLAVQDTALDLEDENVGAN
jgi:hypothetical protein